MKKAYMAPLMEVVRTEAEQMICQSIKQLIGGDSGLGGGGDYTDTTPISADGKDDITSIFDNLW